MLEHYGNILKVYMLERLVTTNTRNKEDVLSLQYHDGSPIAYHLNNFLGIMNQLSTMGIKFDEEKIKGLILLGSLPDSSETFRTSLSNSAPDGVVSMNSAKSTFLHEEMRRKSLDSSSLDVLITGPREK